MQPPRASLWLHLGWAALLCAASACHHASLAHLPGPSLPSDASAGPVDTDGGVAGALALSPQSTLLTVASGQPLPTVQFVATADGQSVKPTWSIDRGELGTISASGLFGASGTAGGTVFVTAIYMGQKASAQVTVKLAPVQNGDPAALLPPPADGGAGGYGGVGGDGPGQAATTQQQQTLEGASPTPDPAVKWLYPYDQTVWPRGLLAPLLQWDPAGHDFDGLYVHIEETGFEYKGTFAPPAGAPAGNFRNLPIPEDIWTEMAQSNGGEPVKVTLVFSQGTTAYGPYTETWHVAQGSLKGTVYYNSYATHLVTNFTPGGATPRFGAATLAIKPGQTDPVVVAGANSNDDSGCRVCHTVSANGSTLITQQYNGGADNYTSLLDLKAGDSGLGTTLPAGVLSFAALYPDASFLISSTMGATLPSGASEATHSQVYSLPDGNLLTVPSWPSDLGAATPAFSPDGTHLAFNFFAGSGANLADQKSLWMIDYTAATQTFSPMQRLYTPSGTPSYAAAWPSFLPDSKGIVFEQELSEPGIRFDTTGGNTAELWWLDLATKQAAPLVQLNGVNLPTGASHANDAVLNYEPTVNPVISGGYAWVVFTSRRLYGNVATIDPWCSDPRSSSCPDLTQNPTPKKLWVAAIDLDAAPGSDPSHPAFYVPAQELHAANSRGFWTVDPCLQDGQGCTSGDECCGGYCTASAGGSPLCASTTSTCAAEFDKCDSDADCCSGAQLSCVNHRCAVTAPPPIK